MKRAVVVVGVALMLGGCAAKQAPPPQPPRVVLQSPPKPETPPPPTGAEILAAQPPEVRQALKQHERSGRWPIYRTAAYVLYPYGEDAEPVVDCVPLRTTDVQLGPGETVTDLALGDQERWMATPASAGDPRNPTPHIALKPQAPGIATNLTIYTTKHIYHIVLRSRVRAMQEVEFYYPDELLSAMAAADQAYAKAAEEVAADPHADNNAGVVDVTAVNPAHLNFSYKIVGANVPARPIRAFDDGTHVYIQMAPGMKSSEAPALLVAAGNGTQMVNYRVQGNYYVVDRLFNQAVLVSGVGRQQDRVTIAYDGGAR